MAKSTAMEVYNRVMHVQKMMQEGFSHESIVAYGRKTWNTGSASIRKYITAVYRRWAKYAEKNAENIYNEHIKMRMNEIEKITSDNKTKLAYMQDLAKLQGLYEEKVKISGKVEVGINEMNIEQLENYLANIKR